MIRTISLISYSVPLKDTAPKNDDRILLGNHPPGVISFSGGYKWSRKKVRNNALARRRKELSEMMPKTHAQLRKHHAPTGSQLHLKHAGDNYPPWVVVKDPLHHHRTNNSPRFIDISRLKKATKSENLAIRETALQEWAELKRKTGLPDKELRTSIIPIGKDG